MRSPPLRPDADSVARRGTSTVEMAIAAPVLVTILLGLLEVSHAFMVQHLIQDAARQGCRAGILPRTTNAAVLAAVDKTLRGEGITTASTTILVNNAARDVSSARAGDIIGVKVTISAADVSIVPGCGYLRGQQMAFCTLRCD